MKNKKEINQEEKEILNKEISDSGKEEKEVFLSKEADEVDVNDQKNNDQKEENFSNEIKKKINFYKNKIKFLEKKIKEFEEKEFNLEIKLNEINKEQELKIQKLRVSIEADFYKRLEKELKEKKNYLLQDAVKKLIPFLDDLRRMIENLNQNKQLDKINFQNNLEIIFNSYKNTLSNLGIKEMDVKVGDKFDSRLHYPIKTEVIDQNDSQNLSNKEITDGGEKNNYWVIKEVGNKGYFLHDIVISHALVTISKINKNNNQKIKSNKGEK
jgi:molecular chaperone GrpE